MGLVLNILSYVGIGSAFVMMTLAIASGLYFLSEQVEEHTVIAKRILVRTILFVITVHVLLFMFDGFPLWISLFSVFTNATYLQNLKRFPFIKLTSKTFLLSCVSVVINHYLWFQHFTDPTVPPYAIYKSNPHYEGKTHPPFSHVASFLGICVWMVPFALFISLSASDNMLPMNNHDEAMMAGMSSGGNGGISIDISAAEKAKKHSTGLAKAIISTCYEWILRAARACGLELDPNYGRIV